MAQFMNKNQQVEEQQHFQKYKNGFQNRHTLYGLIPTWDAPEYSRLQASVKLKGASTVRASGGGGEPGHSFSPPHGSCATTCSSPATTRFGGDRAPAGLPPRSRG